MLQYVWHLDHKYSRRQHFIRHKTTFLRVLDAHDNIAYLIITPTLPRMEERGEHSAFDEYGISI